MAAVRYLVHDVERAVAFYTGRLGFTLDTQMGNAFAIVAHGDLRLWLSGLTSSAARVMHDGREAEPGGWNRIVIAVDDLVGMVATPRAAGLTFRNDIVTGPGGKQIVLDDDSGNAIELFQAA